MPSCLTDCESYAWVVPTERALLLAAAGSEREVARAGLLIELMGGRGTPVIESGGTEVTEPRAMGAARDRRTRR